MKICNIDPEAAEKLPPRFPDKSGIGVHYIDAFIKPMKTTLEDGTPIHCRRRGLKITLTVGDRKGEGLMRRLDVGPDPVAMLRAALLEAAGKAGHRIRIDQEALYLEPSA